MASVQFREVTKTYGAFEAIKLFDLDIEDGEFCVLVGPSGCGKSTALKMLAGLEATTNGSILIGGRDVTDLGPGKRDIAMVFQNYALYPHMSVRKNIGFGLKMHGVDRAEIDRRVDEAARSLELTPYLERKPRELSGGQRQRVALGRAIVREPSVFLMDEPLSNLDAKLRVQTRAEIVKLQRRLGVTTIYVTHDQVEALTMADKIVVMRNGVIQQVGSPTQLFERPANLFVAGFIGSPGMNFFHGEVASEGGALLTSFNGQRVELPADAAPVAATRATFGIRPEHIKLGATGIAAPLSLVESLGTEKVLHLPIPGGQSLTSGEVTFRADEQRDASELLVRVIDDVRYTEGDTVHLQLPIDKIHVFGEEGQALRAR